MTTQELEECIGLYGTDVFSFCLHLALSRQAAEELYQDTMLATAEHVEHIDAAGNVKSYLLSVAVRLWKNRSRKAARRRRIAPEQSLDELFDDGQGAALPESGEPDGLAAVVSAEERDAVRAAVARLKERQRAVVVLHYMHGLDIASIAEVLHVPRGTVKSRLHAARKQLERELEGYYHD